MSRETIEQCVAEVHNESPLERVPTRVEGSLEVIRYKLGTTGTLAAIESGVIQFRSYAVDFSDMCTSWLRVRNSKDNDLIIDPHHPVLDPDARTKMLDVARFEDGIDEFRKLISDLLPSGEAFPLGRADEELRKSGIVYVADS